MARQSLSQPGGSAGSSSALPVAPAATSKPLRIMGSLDDGTLRDYSTTTATAANATTPLTTPTYDGGGQIAEIDVLYFPEGWGSDSNGKAWRYWMVNGPYPAGVSSYENPCILVSDNGQTWQVPPGLTNPIAGTTTGQGNTDPSIFCNTDGTMYVYWCHGFGPSDLQWSKSTDGITWTTAATLIAGSASQFNSPQVIYDGTKYWLYWSVNGSPTKLYYATASSFLGLTTAPTTQATGFGALNVGHCNIRYWQGRYYCLFTDQTHLYYATSLDGIAWTAQTNPVLSASGGANWDSTTIYRTAFVISLGTNGPAIDCWYCGANAGGTYRVGYTRVALGSSGYPLSGAYSILTANGTQATSVVPFSVQAASGQTANLTEWRNSAGSKQLWINSGNAISADLAAGGSINFQDASAANVLRLLQSTAWADTKTSKFMQVGPSTGYVVFTSANGTIASRVMVASTVTHFTTATNAAAPAAGSVIQVDGGIGSNATQTTLTGTTAGTAVSSQPFTGPAYKKVLVYLNGYENTTAVAQTITYPVAFANAPLIAAQPGGFGATATATTLTLPASMGAPVTGWLVLEGF